MRYAALAFVLFSLPVSLTAADLDLGTWKLNPAKSKYNPGPPVKSATITYEASGDGIKRTGESIDASGATIRLEYTAKYDGKDYPVTGFPTADSISLKRTSDTTVDVTLKKGGKITSTGQRMVSKDGKTLTLNTKGTNAKGQAFHNIAVYEKQ